MSRPQQVAAGIGVIVVAILLLYQFHFKDSLFLKCAGWSPVYNKVECLARGGKA